jgi:hypothetical protein
MLPIHQGSSERCALALIADNSDSELRRRRNSGQNEASFSALHNVKSAQDKHKSAPKAHFCSLTSPSFPLFQWQCLPRKRSSPIKKGGEACCLMLAVVYCEFNEGQVLMPIVLCWGDVVSQHILHYSVFRSVCPSV